MSNLLKTLWLKIKSLFVTEQADDRYTPIDERDLENGEIKDAPILEN
jgi:hypothetical protein